MPNRSNTDAVLGVFVTDSLVEAVLMARVENRIQVMHRFARSRSRINERRADLGSTLPGLKNGAESDFTIEVGDGTTGSDPSSLFLSSEFANIGGAVEVKGMTTVMRQTTPITTQLRDILAECAGLGYPSPSMSFCLGSSEILYKELTPPLSEDESGYLSLLGKKKRRPSDEEEPKNQLVSGMARRHLVDYLAEQSVGPFDRKRVQFIPMSLKSGRERFLGVVPRSIDGLTATLKELSSGRSVFSGTACLMDTELSLYLSIAEEHAETTLSKRLAFVRIGPEDTILLFVRDGSLAEFERYRSLTSYDPAETVCSRILLKQDDTKFGELDHVILISEDRQQNTMSAFREYFPSARIEWARDVLAAREVEIPEDTDVHLASTTLPAIGVALRWVENWDREGIGTGLNLIPKKFAKRRRSGSQIAWHTYVVMAAIFGIALYYTTSYMENRQDITKLERQLAVNPPQFAEENPAVLKKKVDSLNAAYASYTKALQVLDSLLVGSDKWTRSIARMSESTAQIGSIWLSSWTPLNATSVRLEGNALSRTRIAELAQRWNGSIEKLNFEDIQNVRVYSFTMTVPIQSEIPPVAEYLRETALEQESDQTIGTK